MVDPLPSAGLLLQVVSGVRISIAGAKTGEDALFDTSLDKKK